MLMEQLSCLFPNEPALCRLIMGHLRRTVEWGGSYKEIKQGLPMGSALSPLLGAIYLSPLDALFAGWKDGFYQRFMDDWVIIQSKRHDLRKTIKRVYAALHTLGLRIAQDKTYIGRVSKGFDFMGFYCCPTGMTVSAAALSRRDQKIARLYEQGASKERVGAYLRQWLGWAGVGLTFAVMVTGCGSKIINVGNQRFYERHLKEERWMMWYKEGGEYDYARDTLMGGMSCYYGIGCNVDLIYDVYRDKFVLVRMGNLKVEVWWATCVNSKKIVLKEKEILFNFGINKKGKMCGYKYEFKCEAIGIGDDFECVSTVETGSDEEPDAKLISCGDVGSCLVVNSGYGVVKKYFRSSVDEYIEIINKIKKHELVDPDEK